MQKKFTLNMVTLVVIVIILSVLVFLSATRSPLSQQPEEEQEVNFDAESLFKTAKEETAPETPLVPETPPAADPQSPPIDGDVIATITFTDNQVPEKQLRPAAPSYLDGDEVFYTVRLHASWSERLHSGWYPQGAHLSPMVAWSHRLQNTLFKENSIASDGMEIMAETGATGTLQDEIKHAVRAGSILSYTTGSVFNAPGEDMTRILINKDAPYITVVSMIAPSPDWFVSVRNVRLYKNGVWQERVRVPAVLYDAGTDNGTEFTSVDSNTRPKQPIARIRNVPPRPYCLF